jgi:hypothetical protein
MPMAHTAAAAAAAAEPFHFTSMYCTYIFTFMAVVCLPFASTKSTLAMMRSLLRPATTGDGERPATSQTHQKRLSSLYTVDSSQFHCILLLCQSESIWNQTKKKKKRCRYTCSR